MIADGTQITFQPVRSASFALHLDSLYPTSNQSPPRHDWSIQLGPQTDYKHKPGRLRYPNLVPCRQILQSHADICLCQNHFHHDKTLLRQHA